RSYTLLALPARQDEMIIVAVTSPGTRWHIPHFYELPVGHIRRRQAQIISYRRGHIQSRSVVKVRFGTLIAENVLKMVRPKRTAILPLRVTHAIAFANGYPAMTADRLARPGIGLLKPRDHYGGLRLEWAVRDIVIRQRAVERILLRNECDGYVIPARPGVRVVRPAIATRPFQVPRASVIRHRVVSAGFFPHPENGRDNI